eukprot:g7612.t1
MIANFVRQTRAVSCQTDPVPYLGQPPPPAKLPIPVTFWRMSTMAHMDPEFGWGYRMKKAWDDRSLGALFKIAGEMKFHAINLLTELNQIEEPHRTPGTSVATPCGMYAINPETQQWGKVTPKKVRTRRHYCGQLPFSHVERELYMEIDTTTEEVSTDAADRRESPEVVDAMVDANFRLD